MNPLVIYSQHGTWHGRTVNLVAADQPPTAEAIIDDALPHLPDGARAYVVDLDELPGFDVQKIAARL